MSAKKAVEPALLAIEYRPLSSMLPALRNAKSHDIQTQKASYERFGMAQAVIPDDRTGRLLSGHGRVEALEAMQRAGQPAPERIIVQDDGEWLVPVQTGVRTANDDEADALVLAYNKVGEGLWEHGLADQIRRELEEKDPSLLIGTGFEASSLSAMLGSAPEIGLGLPPLSNNVAPGAPIPKAPTLAERFLVPPFSILDARQGYWQDRKRMWIDIGIQSDEGRPQNLRKMSETILAAERQETRGGQPNKSKPASNSGNDPTFYYQKQEAERLLGRQLTTEEFERDWYQDSGTLQSGTSIFDPVLSELAYRWWSPPGGEVLDPFAGGSVRGIVAAAMGRRYTGIDLRPEQTQANDAQWAEINAQQGLSAEMAPRWIAGDSLAVLPEMEEQFDFIFSCPPYFDLEAYSEDPADLSVKATYDEFLEGYEQIIIESARRLRQDRFACFVVGDIRDPKGLYRGFVPDTISAFEDAGLQFYNEAILVTAVGSLAMGAGRIFTGGRKLAKAHQNVLVFVKGDWREAHRFCGPIEAADPSSILRAPSESASLAPSGSRPRSIVSEGLTPSRK